MKSLNFFSKIIYFLNIIAALLLLLSYLLPYVKPEQFPFISVLSLGVPLLIILNILFFAFWLLSVKKQMILSLVVLAIGYGHVFSLYKFSASADVDDKKNISIMNYNVRLFNAFDWIKDASLKYDMEAFISENSPDILSIQEYRPDEIVNFKKYYKHENLSGQKVKNGQAIFSKYPIVKKGIIEFPNSSNNAIYADIVKDKDTIRIYNVHLQSMGIDPSTENITNENSKSLLKRISHTFKTQQQQTALFLDHKADSPYKTIVCGDLNNTAYSYVYKEIKGEFSDAFVKAGNGFGRTLDFDFFPVRIDFIFADQEFEINGFKSFDQKFSDHYPIMAKVKLK